MTKVEKYIYTVYLTKSFSEASRELYISQPALSSIIKKHENELGFSIFDRSGRRVTLTYEGRIYIKYLEQNMENERNMYRCINSRSRLQHEKLSVGGKNYASRILLPKICGEFHQRFQKTEIKIDISEAVAVDLFDKLESGLVDLVINFICDDIKYSYVPLFSERYVVAVNRDADGADKLARYALSPEEILFGKNLESKEVDFELFKDIEFIRFGRASSTRYNMAKFIENCRISPCYVYNANKYDIQYDMMLEGMGATITSEIMLMSAPESHDKVFYFLPKSYGNRRQAKIIYKKDMNLSGCAEEFINIAKEMVGTKEKVLKLLYV